jgi:hypothetical protein
MSPGRGNKPRSEASYLCSLSSETPSYTLCTRSNPGHGLSRDCDSPRRSVSSALAPSAIAQLASIPRTYGNRSLHIPLRRVF